MQIKAQKLNPQAILPKNGSRLAAGYDVYACLSEDTVIQPGETKLIPTGFAFQPPEGFYFAVVARSGLAVKQGLRLANCYAVCDEDYRGEYFVPLYNDSTEPRTIKHGDRIAQLLLKRYYTCEFELVDKLDDTERGSGGFGSTGISIASEVETKLGDNEKIVEGNKKLVVPYKNA